jgi:glucose-1-phosphate cytidylyltransferase
MKVVILAGGFGTRLSELTDAIPKPMVKIGGIPILVHIMESYSKYGYNDFVIATGYKSELITEFFRNYYFNNSDFTVDLSSGKITTVRPVAKDWKVTLINTGIGTLTGGRLSKLKPYVADGRFLMTYGDGLCDVNLEDLIAFHKQHKRIATVTAVRPNTRFGELRIDKNLVSTFSEKKQLDQGWINGGFFVFEPQLFEYLDGDQMLEQEPLEKLVSDSELSAFKHTGFWQCMDTKKDLDYLNLLHDQRNLPTSV